MAAKDSEPVLDVQSVVEAVVANDDADVPSYEVESLCMRCEENVFVLFLPFNLSQLSPLIRSLISNWTPLVHYLKADDILWFLVSFGWCFGYRVCL